MRPILVPLLAAAVGVVPATSVRAARVDATARVEVAAGYDSNPLRVSSEGKARGSAFGQLAFRTGLSLSAGRTATWFADAAGVGRRYGSSAGYGDYQRVDLRAGVLLPRLRAGRTRLSLAVGGVYEVRRSTYTDRLSGEIYEVVVDPVAVPPTTVPIPDRFDSDTSGAFLDTSWRVNRRLRLFLDTGYERTDYVTDYTTTTPLDALDFRTVVIEPGFSFRVNDVLVLVGSAARTDFDFDDQPAVDSGGSAVPGTRREYRYTQYRLRAVMTPGRFWELNAGWLGSNREDSYAGYYDFDGWAAFVSASRALGARSRVQLLLSEQRQDYAMAVVPGDPNGDTRGSDVARFATRFDHTFTKQIALFAEGGVQRTDNEDPLFAYDRDWSLIGLAVGWD